MGPNPFYPSTSSESPNDQWLTHLSWGVCWVYLWYSCHWLYIQGIVYTEGTSVGCIGRYLESRKKIEEDMFRGLDEPMWLRWNILYI